MRNLLFSISIFAAAFVASPTLANETTSTEVEVQAPESGQVLASALAGMASSVSSPIAATLVANASCCEAEVTVVTTDAASSDKDESLLSGSISVLNKYVDRDGLILADKPVIQGGLSLDVGGGLALNTWHSYSPFTRTGGETDLGASYTTATAGGELTLSADRYLLVDLADITALGASYTPSVMDGKLTLSVKYYFWDGGNPDATRVEVGYTIEPAKRVTLRPAVVVEDGFGLGTRVLAVADASYALTEKLSLVGSVYLPLKGNGINTVTASFGLQFSF